jgi:hypothetical protein
LALRVPVIEKATGFKFNRGYKPVGSWESLDIGRGKRAAGRYDVETGTLQFAVGLMTNLNRDHRTPVRLMDPSVMAADADFMYTADHELGHALADQVSRRNGLGPWYTPDAFWNLPYDHRLGLTIVSEGTAGFIGHHGRPVGDNSGWFPASDDERRIANGELLVYTGGEWAVSDILRLHGERGLVWLISHPLVLPEYGDMRAVVVAYRTRALAELAGP